MGSLARWVRHAAVAGRECLDMVKMIGTKRPAPTPVLANLEPAIARHERHSGGAPHYLVAQGALL